MVFGIFAPLAGIVKVSLSKTQIDNGVFKLHYKFASSYCFIACCLLAISDFIGAPIHCMKTDTGPTKAQITSCWVISTYSINRRTGLSKMYSQLNGLGTPSTSDELTYHAYYQFVPLVLFLQGCLFYVPHYIWKLIEGKRIHNLLQGLDTLSFMDDSSNEKKMALVKYIHQTTNLNQKFCFGYIFCECLNFVSVFGQMLALDKFFEGAFWTLGSDSLASRTQDETTKHTLIHRFPLFTKCLFRHSGPSGSTVPLDFLCVLPQNLLNCKIFLIMWFVLVVMIALSAIQLLFRVILISSSMVRVKLFLRKCKMQEDSSEMAYYIGKMSLGNYFLLNSVAKNVGALCFRDIINMALEEDELHKEIGRRVTLTFIRQLTAAYIKKTKLDFFRTAEKAHQFISDTSSHMTNSAE